MILRCKWFSDWLTQNISKSGMGYYYIIFHLLKELAWEFHFQHRTGMSQIICTCMLLIATFLFAHLSSYCLLYALLLSNTTFTPTVIFCWISTGPIDLFLDSFGVVWFTVIMLTVYHSPTQLFYSINLLSAALCQLQWLSQLQQCPV